MIYVKFLISQNPLSTAIYNRMINLLYRDKVLGTPNIIIAIEAAKRATELLENISNGTPAEKIKEA